MVRPARPDEKPRFGQVWTWGDEGKPLMAVAPDPDPQFAGAEWLFIRLPFGQTVKLFWTGIVDRDQPLSEWRLLDD